MSRACGELFEGAFFHRLLFEKRVARRVEF
jgi:hypothetical protein